MSFVSRKRYEPLGDCLFQKQNECLRNSHLSRVSKNDTEYFRIILYVFLRGRVRFTSAFPVKVTKLTLIVRYYVFEKRIGLTNLCIFSQYHIRYIPSQNDNKVIEVDIPSCQLISLSGRFRLLVARAAKQSSRGPKDKDIKNGIVHMKTRREVIAQLLKFTTVRFTRDLRKKKGLNIHRDWECTSKSDAVLGGKHYDQCFSFFRYFCFKIV